MRQSLSYVKDQTWENLMERYASYLAQAAVSGNRSPRSSQQKGGKVICAARTLKEGDHPLEGSLEHTVAGIKTSGGEAAAVAVNISEYDDCVRLIDAGTDRLP